DWHCLHSGGRPDIFAMTLRLAREYGLALRVGSHPEIEQIRSMGLPADDYDLLDSFRLNLDHKAAAYTALLRALPAGLTEWAVHPSLGGAASQALDPDGWRVRRTDFDFVTSPDARAIIEEEGIILIGYAPLQQAWQAASA
ncbi:MAG TPA: ChbG/HpnK family deacetylase, partial [Thermomicrobiales bacterium]|nr:ChbG/HpnK family deacetylase [Thermomicrobiales bacterium]